MPLHLPVTANVFRAPDHTNFCLSLELVTITIGLAFLSAAIYVTLSQTITHLAPSCSRFPPWTSYYLFIPCDIISLALQAAGGGISSSTIGKNQAGVNITLAGLSFQVLTLTLFVGLAVDYAVRCRKFRRSQEKIDGDLGVNAGRAKENPLSNRFNIFLSFLSPSIICILIRCAYRIDELNEGYHGKLFHKQGLLIRLEGV